MARINDHKVNATDSTSGLESKTLSQINLSLLDNPPTSCGLDVLVRFIGYCAADGTCAVIHLRRRFAIDDEGAVQQAGAVQAPEFSDIPATLVGIATVVSHSGATVKADVTGILLKDITWTSYMSLFSSDYVG